MTVSEKQHKAVSDIEDALAAYDTKRKDIIPLYQVLIVVENNDEARINWGWINHRIIERWGLTGLKYIKSKAWGK